MTNDKKIEKIAGFVKKNAKNRNVKMLKTLCYHYKLTVSSNLLSNPRVGSSKPRADKFQQKIAW